MIEGERFSQVYLDKGKLANDSVRMRNRLSAFYKESLGHYEMDFIKSIHKETGSKVPFKYSGYQFSLFIEECDIRDLLDSVTLIFKCLESRATGNSLWLASQWHEFVTRVFKEENLGYRLDPKGGVHFYIDGEFDRNKASLILGLEAQPAVKDAVEKSYSFLDQNPSDTASAIKSIFEALEILYKHIVRAENKDRLNSIGVQNKLRPKLQLLLANNKIALKAAEHLMDGLCDWIDAGHLYRHGQRIEEPLPPPLDLTVLFISQGASYIRYLLPLA